jgi:glycosyltransferase involved in cell wall biosynthesis
MKKAAIFDPYLDTIGGGEVYTCAVAECLLGNGFDVEIFWKEKKILGSIKGYLGIDITKAEINPLGYKLFTHRGNWVKKILLTKKYDLIFFLSDGSIPPLFSRNNILHFQIPFTKIQGQSLQSMKEGRPEKSSKQGLSLLDKRKIQNIHHIICNSRFTKKFIDRTYSVDSKVLYPPINISPSKEKKQNIILSVGRFTETLHHKRQDVLVSTFKELVTEGLKSWELVLIGSSKEGKKLVREITKQSEGYPIKIITDVDHKSLEKEYARASIFWHAAGFEVDGTKNPELVEHFGIATAEAMAAGCVPIVINKGGQPEIVKNGENGYLWDSTDSLKKYTLQLIKSPEKIKQLAKKAKEASKRLSKERFCREFSTVVK